MNTKNVSPSYLRTSKKGFSWWFVRLRWFFALPVPRTPFPSALLALSISVLPSVLHISSWGDVIPSQFLIERITVVLRTVISWNYISQFPETWIFWHFLSERMRRTGRESDCLAISQILYWAWLVSIMCVRVCVCVCVCIYIYYIYISFWSVKLIDNFGDHLFLLAIFHTKIWTQKH